MKGRELRLKTIELIEAGGATVDSLMEATGVESKSAFSKVMSQLRMMEKFGVQDDKGVFSFVSYEDYEKQKTATAAPKEKKFSKIPPQTRLMRANKAVLAKIQAEQNAQVRANKNPEHLITLLKLEMAKTARTIAELELSEVRASIVEQFDLPNDEAIDTYEDLDVLLEQDEVETEEEMV